MPYRRLTPEATHRAMLYGHPLPPWTPQVARLCISLVTIICGYAYIMASLLLEFLG
jgi:hypothetical protein